MKKVISLILITVLQCCNLTFAQVDNRGVRNKPAPPTEKRLALVIGNSTYQNTAALPNPQNDAADMKAALESLGFEVLYGVNPNARQMKALMRQFGDKLLQNKGVGLFYYAGHGIASGGENYLVPTDADIPAEDEIQDATVSLSFLLSKMAVADNSLNIVILDACRNNPFARKWRTMRDSSTEGGLATIRQAPTGTLIAYATQPGNTASDGTGRNGLYTQELLTQMKKPDLAIEEVFKNVRGEVRRKSKNLQVPWESSSIEGRFCFLYSGNSAESNYVPPVKLNLRKFKWEYKFEPDPGFRYWTQTDAETWEEKYWNGKTSVFKLRFETVLEKCGGIIVSPLENPNFQIFIPNKTCQMKWIRGRHFIDGKWQETWNWFGEITEL